MGRVGAHTTTCRRTQQAGLQEALAFVICCGGSREQTVRLSPTMEHSPRARTGLATEVQFRRVSKLSPAGKAVH